MPGRLLVALAVFLAIAGQAAAAKGVEVSVRVEGLASTLFEGKVNTTVHLVDGGDGSGLHTCSGPLGETASPSLTGALDDVLKSAGLSWRGGWDPSAGDFLIDSVAGQDATPATPWSTLLNGVPTPTGGCSTRVKTGDRVLLAYDAIFKPKSLSLAGPGKSEPGQEFSLLVTDDRTEDGPVTGATVSGADGLTSTTGNDGRARLTLEAPGKYSFRASHPDGIRSNSVTVCVSIDSPDCETGPEPTGPPTRILKIDQGQRFMRGAGPRILRGRVNGSSQVRIAIRRTGRKNGPRGLVWSQANVSGTSWARRIGPLRPGSYRLFSRAVGTDAAQPWITGINRTDFRISKQRLNRGRLANRSRTYLRRVCRTATVWNSELLRGWVTIALGGHRRGAKLLVGNLLAKQLPDGSFDGDLNQTAMAVVALRRTRPVAAARAADWIASRQHEDGGFGFGSGPASDVDSTGLAAWVMALTGRHLQARSAANFIQSLQNDDGGFPAVSGAGSNAQSTGLGLVGLRVAGRPLLKVRTEDGISPLHYLATLQRRNGAINYAPGLATTPSWVTAQATLGITPRAGLLRTGSEIAR